LILRTLVGIISLFLRVEEKNCFPEPLSRDEEKRYFVLCKQGDKKAREKLILHNLRLVAHIVKKYYVGNKNQDDLISIGTIGLIKAIDSYEPSTGTRFATYASKCLQNEILMYFRSQKKTMHEVSINETIDTDKEGNPLTYMDVVCTEESIADDIFIQMSSQKARSIIENKLESREREVVILRYGLGRYDPMTQKEVASKLGISRSYVSRIEKAALSKIKESL